MSETREMGSFTEAREMDRKLGLFSAWGRGPDQGPKLSFKKKLDPRWEVPPSYP